MPQIYWRLISKAFENDQGGRNNVQNSVGGQKFLSQTNLMTRKRRKKTLAFSNNLLHFCGQSSKRNGSLARGESLEFESIFRAQCKLKKTNIAFKSKKITNSKMLKMCTLIHDFFLLLIHSDFTTPNIFYTAFFFIHFIQTNDKILLFELLLRFIQS